MLPLSSLHHIPHPHTQYDTQGGGHISFVINHHNHLNENNKTPPTALRRDARQNATKQSLPNACFLCVFFLCAITTHCIGVYLLCCAQPAVRTTREPKYTHTHKKTTECVCGVVMVSMARALSMSVSTTTRAHTTHTHTRSHPHTRAQADDECTYNFNWAEKKSISSTSIDRHTRTTQKHRASPSPRNDDYRPSQAE